MKRGKNQNTVTSRNAKFFFLLKIIKTSCIVMGLIFDKLVLKIM